MSRETKPKLDIEAQIQHLLKKGVKFNYISIEHATQYLKENNNYFKLRAYRKNFPKHPAGAKAGTYIDLDFAMLKDLAIIDMRLRYILIQMALDVEHFAKVKLIQSIEKSSDDGYQIVQDYFDQLKQDDKHNDSHRYDTLWREIERNTNNPYCGGIISTYQDEFPIWAFVEIIPLGTLIHFYGFCANKLNNKSLLDDFYLLKAIKEVRNAAAHNNCILNDMRAHDRAHKTNYNVLRALNPISKSTLSKRLSNERMRQIITLFYTHSVLVTSKGVRNKTRKLLKEFTNRLYYHIDYYQDNLQIRAIFNFLFNTVDILFP